MEARNFLNQVSNPATLAVPYRQLYTHSVWGELTAREGKYWSGADSFTAVFSNGRRSGWQYDAAGNVTSETTNTTYSYDAVGRNTTTHPFSWNNSTLWDTNQWFDGDGNAVKWQQHTAGIHYYLRSSVLGGKIVADLHGETISSYYGQNWVIGSKAKGYVYAGEIVVEQSVLYHYSASTPPWEAVKWKHVDPVSGSDVESWVGGVSTEHEYDPMGVDTGFEDPANASPPYVPDPEVPTYSGSSANGVHCMLDNVSIDCADAFQLVHARAAAIAPPQTTETRVNQYGERYFVFFRATADGRQGFATYLKAPGSWYHEASETEGWLEESQLSPCNNILQGLFGGDGTEPRMDYDINFGKGGIGVYRGEDLEKRTAAFDRVKKDPVGAQNSTINTGVNWSFDPEHLYWNPHIYGSNDGLKNGEIFIPKGYNAITKPYGGSDAINVHYERLGSARDVTLVIRHITDFKIQNAGGRVRIGQTGGQGGGQAKGYLHVHLELYQGNFTKKTRKSTVSNLGGPGLARDKFRISIVAALCK